MIAGKRLAKYLVGQLYEKKAYDITLIDVRKQCGFTNYFLIISGKNIMHLDALKACVDEAVDEKKVEALGVDGKPESGWIIYDLGDLIIHIFSPETRAYYGLQSYWGDSKVVDLGIDSSSPDD